MIETATKALQSPCPVWHDLVNWGSHAKALRREVKAVHCAFAPLREKQIVIPFRLIKFMSGTFCRCRRQFLPLAVFSPPSQNPFLAVRIHTCGACRLVFGCRCRAPRRPWHGDHRNVAAWP